ncbi:NUDIX domain-containing protein [Demequina sp. NBRC 110055]|uniref:NUDIX hydrolase n=1 Tax=Demequina sp. NBRC 110055 TaxID=1570344 RepID=UPI0009FBBA67|nr:NUDIX domain-containing protein [Demequina sp. NBRC 110055]
MPTPIVVSAVVLRDAEGRVLTVRKRGTELFMFPGGKHEPGESAAQAAVRETHEELGVELEPALLTPLGTFVAAAANEDGYEVHADVFAHPPVVIGEPLAEIEELRWVAPDAPTVPLAPLLRDHVFPVLAAQ